MFVILNSNADYCLLHYQLIVQIATSSKKVEGKLSISIQSPSNNSHTEVMNENFMPGENYTRLIIRNPDNGALSDIHTQILWNPNIDFENVSIHIKTIQFRYMSHINEM